MRLLEGVRILAIEQYGAGPFGTMILADLGADVIKIENPREGGDVSRYIPPYAENQDSLFFQSFNRNKRSIALDLQEEEGRAIFEALVKEADVVFNNLRGDLPERLGLTYEALAPINPRIVCVSLSGFGRTGPRMADPGYDPIVQALSGMMDVTGEADGPPTRCGISVIDFAGGLTAGLAILAGLNYAKTSGRGCDLDTSLFDVAISMMTYFAAWTLNRGYQPKRIGRSAHPSLVPVQLFKTKDGYIYIMCQKEKFWVNLCELIGRPELAEDPRFNSFAQRLEHRDILTEILDEALSEKTTAEWVALFGRKVPCAPVNTIEQALNDPHTLERGLIIEVDHPFFGRLKEAASPVHVVGGEPMQHRPAPPLGFHTDEILREIGRQPASMGDRGGDE